MMQVVRSLAAVGLGVSLIVTMGLESGSAAVLALAFLLLLLATGWMNARDPG